MIPELQKKEFLHLISDTIKHKVYRIESEHDLLSYAVIIQFDGDCGYGSQGDSNCSYMQGVVEFVKSVFDAEAIILDFRNLSYEWGDRMSQTILAAYCFQLDPVILISDKCYNGLYSLIDEEMSKIPEEYLFWEEEKAIECLVKKYTFLNHVVNVINKEEVYSSDIHQAIKCDWNESLQLDKNRNKRGKALSLFLFYRSSSINLEFLTDLFKEECKFAKYTKSKSNVDLSILTELILANGGIKELELFCSEISFIKDISEPPSYTKLSPLLILFVLNYLKDKIVNSTTKSDLDKYTYCENLFLTFSKSSGVSIP